jgi:hypothetical protein
MRQPIDVTAKDFTLSPENTTDRVNVVRWHDIHGTPVLFFVVDEHGHELRRFPYEPDAIAYAEQTEREMAAEEAATETTPC